MFKVTPEQYINCILFRYIIDESSYFVYFILLNVKLSVECYTYIRIRCRFIYISNAHSEHNYASNI